MATDNPVSAFFSAFRGAQDRNRALEQQQAANQLNEQLRQIQMLNAQRQWQEANKTPEQRAAEAEILANQALAAEARKLLVLGPLQQALARGSFTTSGTPLPGTITQPQVVTPESTQALSDLINQQISPSSLSLGESAGIPTNLNTDLASQVFAPSPPPVPIDIRTPLEGGGFTSTALGRQEEERKIREAGRLAGVKEKTELYTIQDPNDISKKIVIRSKPSEAPSGAEGYVKPTSGRSVGPTANAQANILGKAGTAKITSEEIESKYTKDGVTDWNRLIIDSNKKISEDKSLAAEEKLKQIPAAERGKANGFIAAHKGLGKLLVEINKFKIEGKDLDSWNRAVGTALEAPPDGIFSALYQSAIGQSLTGDEQTINALKAMVRSAVTKANAGLSQTEREIANVSQYVPKTNDTIEETLRKGALLETYLIDQVESITTDPKEWLTNIKAEKAGNPPPTTDAPQGGATSTSLDSLRNKYLK